MLRAMERTLGEADTELHFANLLPSGHQSIPWSEALDSLIAKGLDAIACCAVNSPVTPDLITSLRKIVDAGGPALVLISHEEVLGLVPNVYYDSRLAGYQAAHHLLRQGYQDLVFVAPFTARWVEARWEGIEEAIRQFGDEKATLRRCPPEGPNYDVDGSHPEGGTHFFETGHRAAVPLFAGDSATTTKTGIIAANDKVAYGVLQAAQEQGKIAGVHFGLIGFDDDSESRLCNLTSLSPPLEDMGQEAARLLLHSRQGKTIPMHVRLRSHLVPRSSTRAIR